MIAKTVLLILILISVSSVAAAKPREGEDLAPAQLRVLIRDADYIASRKKVMPDLVAQPVAGNLWASYVLDLGKMSIPLRRRDLAKLGINEVKAKEIALANVKKEIGDVASLIKVSGEPQAVGYLSPAKYYNCGLMLAQSDWGPIAKKMKGKLLVSVPTDEMVLYIDSNQESAMEVFKAVTGKMFAEAKRPVSKQIVEWSEKGWKAVGDVEPPSVGPGATPLKFSDSTVAQNRDGCEGPGATPLKFSKELLPGKWQFNERDGFYDTDKGSKQLFARRHTFNSNGKTPAEEQATGTLDAVKQALANAGIATRAVSATESPQGSSGTSSVCIVSNRAGETKASMMVMVCVAYRSGTSDALLTTEYYDYGNVEEGPFVKAANEVTRAALKASGPFLPAR